jgi:hypothetical protein
MFLKEDKVNPKGGRDTKRLLDGELENTVPPPLDGCGH